MTMRDYLEEVKRKPEHIRQRIALGSSLGITGIVAAGWLTALLSSGSLALAPASPETNTEFSRAATETNTAFTNLLGAAHEFTTAADGGGLSVIDAGASSTIPAREEEDTRTVIPF